MDSKKPSATGTLDGILKGMMERARNQSTHDVHPETAGLPCLCQGNLYHIKATGEQRIYEICPHCNPRRTCARCGGTGHRQVLNPETSEPEFAPLGCDCVISEQRVQLLNSAQIPEKYLLAEFSFGNVLHGLTHVPEDMAEKFSQNQASIMKFCEHAHACIKGGIRPGDRYFLVLTGPVGTGKTHMGICALKNLIWDYGHSGRFIDFQALLHRIRDTYSKKGSEDDIMRPLRQVDVLLIDEFGKGRTENEWELGVLDDLVNSRYNGGRVTIITTNYLPPELHRELLRSSRGQKNTTAEASTEGAWYLQKPGESRTHPTESYWSQSLPQRIGERMYDRIVEVSRFVDFTGIPSFRRKAAEEFLSNYVSKNPSQS